MCLNNIIYTLSVITDAHPELERSPGSITMADIVANRLYRRQFGDELLGIMQRLQAMMFEPLFGHEPRPNQVFNQLEEFDYLFGRDNPDGSMGALLRPFFEHELTGRANETDDIIRERALTVGAIVHQPEEVGARVVLDLHIGFLPLSSLWVLSQFSISFRV